MYYTVSKGEKYRHYKGGVYTIHGMATHTEDEVRLVTYSDEADNFWARPVDMFFGYLDDGNKRFTLVADEEEGAMINE